MGGATGEGVGGWEALVPDSEDKCFFVADHKCTFISKMHIFLKRLINRNRALRCNPQKSHFFQLYRCQPTNTAFMSSLQNNRTQEE